LFPYWLIFSYFALGALTQRPLPSSQKVMRPMLAFGALLIIVMIGLRYQVGADWNSYQFMFDYAGVQDLDSVLEIGDPAYQFLNWEVNQLGQGIWLVNLICAIIFTWGLYTFAKAQSDPWLAMLVAIPYLVIVVAMGYTRQAVAIGIIMAGLAALQRGASPLRFSLYVAAAALFHRTAVVVLPIVLLATGRTRFFNMFAGIGAFFLLYDIFLADSVETFISAYIETEYSSQGAAIRIAMSVIPALFFLAAHHRFEFDRQEERIWRYFSFAALVFLTALIIVPSSTAVDRLALYILPLQIAIFTRAPVAYTSAGFGRLLVILYSAALQLVWLNFAIHSEAWVPYQFYPIAVSWM
jgi:hypothetical protein